MTVNFFDARCQESTKESIFGLCDEPSPSTNPAYIDTDDPSKWIATVDNGNQIEVTFTAIDKCIEISDSDGDRCDGMLTYNGGIIFVELKERKAQNKVWAGKGDEQLRNTIRLFKENHDLDNYMVKKAYIANKRRPNFQSSQTERMQKFLNDTGFRLRIEATINLE